MEPQPQTVTITLDIATYNDILKLLAQREKHRAEMRKRYVPRKKPGQIFTLEPVTVQPTAEQVTL